MSHDDQTDAGRKSGQQTKATESQPSIIPPSKGDWKSADSDDEG